MNPSQCTAGTGHLGIDVVAGQSATTSVWATSPLKIVVPRARGSSVSACMSTLGGGLVAGDQIALTVRLGEKARCFLNTQASTKVYRSANGRSCSHRLRAQLGSGSLFVFNPDPVQAFKGSCYRQHQEFSLAQDSGLVLVDWLCSGRAARGERWAFRHFQSRNEIFLGDSRVVMDSLLLDPGDGPLEGAYRVGRFNCLALVAVIGAPLASVCAHLLADILQEPLSRRRALICSASPVNQGVLVRLAGESVETVGKEIHRLLDFIPELLNDDPWSRKW